MRVVVANLTEEDMVAITAYVASLGFGARGNPPHQLISAPSSTPRTDRGVLTFCPVAADKVR